jgi:hypothetical protein
MIICKKKERKMLKKYQKRPVVVQAIKYNGTKASATAIEALFAQAVTYIDGKLQVATLEGTMTANAGDFIIKGTKGEVYPCKPDIFESIYDAVDE